MSEADPGTPVPPSTARTELLVNARRRILAGEQHRNAAPPPGFSADPRNRYAVIGGVPVVAWPLGTPWSAQAVLTQVEEDDLVDTAASIMAWYAEHADPGAGEVEVLPAQAPVLAEALGLVEHRRFQVRLATGEVPEVPGVLEPPQDLEELVPLFGVELRCMLVGQLDRPDWELWVLRDETGRAFADVRLMDLGDTVYVAGLGVEEAARGQGWGRAISALATRRALQRSDVVWLHCEDHLGPLYESVGYELIDTHLYLGTPLPPTSQ